MNDTQLKASFNDHLQLSGLPEQFASQADAYLHVDEDYLPVHAAVLAAHSSVFADMFKLASKNDTTAHRRNGRMCIPMTSHTFGDVCTAVKFLYQWTVSDMENRPSWTLWSNIDTARPVLRFAHKFNMRSVLKDCDICLTKKAQIDQGRQLFCTTDAVAMWAVLAEDCNLTYLLAHAELFMAKTMTPKSWMYDNPAASQLSSACLLRVVLRAAQEYITALRQALADHEQALQQHQPLTNSKRLDVCLSEGCGNMYNHACCNVCLRDTEPKLAPAHYAAVEELRRWQPQHV